MCIYIYIHVVLTSRSYAQLVYTIDPCIYSTSTPSYPELCSRLELQLRYPRRLVINEKLSSCVDQRDMMKLWTCLNMHLHLKLSRSYPYESLLI